MIMLSTILKMILTLWSFRLTKLLILFGVYRMFVLITVKLAKFETPGSTV